jgi:hypothetical protein
MKWKVTMLHITVNVIDMELSQDYQIKFQLQLTSYGIFYIY